MVCIVACVLKISKGSATDMLVGTGVGGTDFAHFLVMLLPGAMGGCVIVNLKLQVTRHNPATISGDTRLGYEKVYKRYRICCRVETGLGPINMCIHGLGQISGT